MMVILIEYRDLSNFLEQNFLSTTLEGTTGYVINSISRILTRSYVMAFTFKKYHKHFSMYEKRASANF